MPDFGRWTSNGGDPSLNDINRADKFLDALASEQPVFSTDHADAELAFLLSGWRDEIRQVPIDHVVPPHEAQDALQNAVNFSSRRRNRRSLAVIGSAAAAVLCLGGFASVVYSADPGDGLYGLHTMLFGDQKRQTSDEAVVLAAQTEMQQVQQLIDTGQWDQAQDRLAALSTKVQSVETVERKSELIQQWNSLTYKVVEQNPAATLPPAGEPLPVLPSSPLTLLPLPVIENTTTVTTTTAPEATSVTTTTGSEVLLTTTTPPSDTTTSPSSETASTTSGSAPSSTTTTSVAPSTTTSTTAAETTTAATTTTTSAAPQTTTTTAAPSTATTTTTEATVARTTTTVAPSVAQAPSVTSVAPPTQQEEPSAPPARSQAPQTPTEQPVRTPVETTKVPAAEPSAPQRTPEVIVTTTTVPGGH